MRPPRRAESSTIFTLRAGQSGRATLLAVTLIRPRDELDILSPSRTDPDPGSKEIPTIPGRPGELPTKPCVSPTPSMQEVYVTVPSTVTQLVVLLVLVVPGFVYQAVRIRIAGRKPGDTDLPTRVLEAIVISTAFALVYLIIFGPEIRTPADAQERFADSPRITAAVGVAAAFVIPSISAFVVNPKLRSSVPTALRRPRETYRHIRSGEWTRFDPRPSAWDVAFQEAGVGFVRVRTADGTWIAGYYGPLSYASSHPDPRNLFLELGYHVESDGTIGEVITGSAGLVVDCSNALVVELLTTGEATETRPDTEDLSNDT